VLFAADPQARLDAPQFALEAELDVSFFASDHWRFVHRHRLFDLFQQAAETFDYADLAARLTKAGATFERYRPMHGMTTDPELVPHRLHGRGHPAEELIGVDVGEVADEDRHPFAEPAWVPSPLGIDVLVAVHEVRGASAPAHGRAVHDVVVHERERVDELQSSRGRDHALVVGNPGRRIGWVCLCGRHLHDLGARPVRGDHQGPAVCPSDGTEYAVVGDRCAALATADDRA